MSAKEQITLVTENITFKKKSLSDFQFNKKHTNSALHLPTRNSFGRLMATKAEANGQVSDECIDYYIIHMTSACFVS